MTITCSVQYIFNPHACRVLSVAICCYSATELIQNLLADTNSQTILEESLTSLEDKLSRDFRYLNVNIGCRLMGR